MVKNIGLFIIVCLFAAGTCVLAADPVGHGNLTRHPKQPLTIHRQGFIMGRLMAARPSMAAGFLHSMVWTIM